MNDNSVSKPLRLLILDDEEPIRRVMKTALTRAGHQVETAANGRQGLQILLRQTFDVAVVDLRMQEMDGVAFIQEARKIWPWQGFVIYSGFIDDSAVAMARREGVHHILTKPIDMPVLLKAVQDEASRCREQERHPDRSWSMPLIGHQLAIMRHLSRDLLHSRNVLNGLTHLGQLIHDMMPYDAMAILGREDDDTILLLQRETPQPAAAIAHLRQYVVERYQALSGRPLDESRLRIEHRGPPDRPGDGGAMHSLTSVPVMVGDEVQGMLCLGAARPDAFSDLHVALLYHTASHLSTLLTALGEMRQLAIRDPLTSLYNRRHLEEELERAWRLAMRHHQSISLMILDLDQFKTVNDAHGHAAGDQLLQHFADLLRGEIRATDMIARLGGDEFVMLLPLTNADQAGVLAERILDKVRARTITIGDQPLALRTSIGIASWPDPHPIDEPEELVKRADRALYQAKHLGRDRFVCWSPSEPAPHKAQIPPRDRDRRPRILVVDDEEYVVMILRRILENESCEVATARTVTEAREWLHQAGDAFDIMLCDLSLPDGDGFELLREARERDPDIVNIIISGHATADNAIIALREGAYDFVQKPVIGEALIALVNRARQFRLLQRENKRYREHLEEMVRAKKVELSKALRDLQQAYAFTLETMVAMLDAREFETGQHSVRVRDLTLVLASEMGIEGEQLEEIGRGALLHDIGKIGIPDSILLKPGKLTEEEWEIMRRHPDIGYRFVKNNAFLETAAGIVLSHHERWDGSGYPQQLKGEAINLGARIFAVIDAYDAMRSARVYKQSISAERAAEEIAQQAGAQFDPRVVEAFHRCVTKLEQIGRWSQSFA